MAGLEVSTSAANKVQAVHSNVLSFRSSDEQQGDIEQFPQETYKLASISHDMRNFLTVLIGYAQLALASKSEHSHKLESVLATARRAHGFVIALLDDVRIKGDDELTEFPLNRRLEISTFSDQVVLLFKDMFYSMREQLLGIRHSHAFEMLRASARAEFLISQAFDGESVLTQKVDVVAFLEDFVAALADTTPSGESVTLDTSHLREDMFVESNETALWSVLPNLIENASHAKAANI